MRPMLGWVVGGLAMVVAVAVLLRGRMYRRLFSDAHFIEIGQRMPGLKAAALAKVIPLAARSEMTRTHVAG
jgi:hypothetical protein